MPGTTTIQEPGAAALGPSSACGLGFEIASSLEDVLEAWGVVHQAYVRAGIIQARPEAIHTVPQALGPHTMVALGRMQGLAVSTLSVTLDSPAGLWSDTVYNAQLEPLRREGRKLMEVGLFADRREELPRSFAAVMELMRIAFHFGYHNGVTDAVAAILPRHARVYASYFSFEPIGPECVHPAMPGRSVILMRVNGKHMLDTQQWTAAFRYFLERPIPPQAYQRRYLFPEDQVSTSRLGAFARS